MEDTVFHMLLRLPLFQGMSRDDLFAVLGQTTFRFSKVAAGKPVFQQGERCDELTFLMNGCLVAETKVPEANFSFAEELNAYTVIEPQSMFGRHPCYKSTYTAKGEVSMLSIDKLEVYELLELYEIFRINLLNLLSSKAENYHGRLWGIAPHGLEGRFAFFIYNLCTSVQGTKILRVKMDDLAGLLDDTRLNVSRILNRWREEGLIAMHRKEFVIHDIAELLQRFSL